MKKYDKYKDSGIEWIGEIPEHWDVKPLRYCLRKKITDGPHETPKFLLYGVPFLSVDGIKNGELYFDNCRKISQEEHERYKQKCRVEKNDILMGKAASIGKIARVKVDYEFGIWSPLALLKPNLSKLQSTFLEYFLKSEYAQFNIMQLSTFNTQRNISMQDIPKISLTLPKSIKEQAAIASYLDGKTAEIDELINQKEHLIKLYEEEKTTIINQAVTKGIKTDVKFKDSGIEWLGEIPENWKMKKLKYVSDLRSGRNLTSSQIKLSDSFPVYGGNGLRGYYSEFTHNGDFVLIGRQGALCGNINYAKGGFWATEHAVVATPKVKYQLIWFGELLRTMNLNQYSVAAAQPGLAVDSIKNLTIPVPSFKEQTAIVQYIETETTRINAKAEKTKRLIELLKEYKTVLISEVVTGKIKVIKERVL